ncbi:rhodanese-like domain-containing protein [Persicobacter diffluens]|uniref:Rhodanese domain-containing protein n=1 Tax=Persicobacter diffluens TaxID=981 RepID=A0AAN5ANT5_9BACT|nr:hypothetical protein PEDI_42080 [Persicobacter diffluens]
MIQQFKQFLGFGSNVDYQELIENGAKVVDVRSREEYASGHAEGSLNIPVNEVPQKIQQIKNLKSPVILCCASGMRASSVMGILKDAGMEVYNAGSWMNV